MTDDAPILGEEFWKAREALGHIRQAAHARQRSAPAVLQAVLARVAAGVPHTVKLPPVVGQQAPLCWFAIAVAPPGVGKSTAAGIAAELVPLGSHVADQLPAGSGEGLVEVLFDVVEEEGPDGKCHRVKRQVRYGAYVFVDEGEVLDQLGGRQGSTLLSTMRTIWSGGPLGQTNATADRRRIVPPGQYVYGVFVGIQTAVAETLLAKADVGTPQRFAWVEATDPAIPDDPPPWPGRLPWSPPVPRGAGEGGPGFATHYLPVEGEVVAEIRAADRDRARGVVAVDALDGHLQLLQLKAAGLLAILDGRVEITGEDWDLAGLIRQESNRVRSLVLAAITWAARAKEQATSQRLAARAASADAAVQYRRIVTAAEKLARKVWEAKETTVAEMRRSMRSYREVFDDALDRALDQGLVVETAEPGQGANRRVLRPGQGGGAA